MRSLTRAHCLSCSAKSCRFWLMDPVLSTYLWVIPAILFKPCPHKWGQLDSDFSRPASLCFVWEILLIIVSVCLSLRPYLPAFFALLSIRLGAPCISGKCSTTELHPICSACFSVFELLGGFSLMSGCVPLFLLAEGQIELPCAESSLFPINCGWAACSGLGACWDSCLSCALVFYSLCSTAI